MEPNTPTATPAAASAAATPSTPAEPAAPSPAPAAAPAKPAAGLDAALEVIRAMRAAGAEPETPAAPVAEAPAVAQGATPAAEVPAPKPTPTPEEASPLLPRLLDLESKFRSQSDELKTLRERAKAADEWEAAARAAEAGDASGLFGRIKWTPETVAKYAEGGKDALAPELTAKKVETLEQELARLKQERQVAEQRAAIDNYKAVIRQEVPGLAKDFPTLVRFHSDPDTGALDASALADEVFAFQANMYRTEQRQLTVAEAATALEASLTKLQRRFGQPAAPPPAAVPPAAPQPPARVPASPASRPAVSDDPNAAGEEAALSVIRQFQAAARAARG